MMIFKNILIYFLSNKYMSKTIIAVTHNNRLQCFFTKLKPNHKNKKFMNCSIIKCSLNEEKYKQLKFELVYQGVLDPTEGKDITLYWNKNDFNDTFKSIEDLDILNPFIISGIKEIFLVRHGKGNHNGVNILQKGVALFGKLLTASLYSHYKDAELVEEGYKQAMYAAKELIKLEPDLRNSKLYFAASHLKRSQQTCAEIQYILGKHNKINIIPCLHELKYVKDGNCDGSGKQLGGIFEEENKPTCTSGKGSCKEIHVKTINDHIEENKIYNLNWNYYTDFYKNKRCRDTNMLVEIIKGINHSNTTWGPNTHKKYLKYKEKYLMLKEKYFNDNL